MPRGEILTTNSRIRKSVPDDAEAITHVQIRSSQDGFAGIFPADALATLDPKPRVALWRERLPLVAEEGGEIVGFAHVGPSDEEPVGEVDRLFGVCRSGGARASGER